MGSTCGESPVLPSRERSSFSVIGTPGRIKKLDTALGAGFLVGGTIGTVAAGPAALPALGMFAAVWAWLEPKDQAIELLKQAVGKLSEKFPGSAGYERRQLMAQRHIRRSWWRRSLRYLGIARKQGTSISSRSRIKRKLRSSPIIHEATLFFR